MKFCFFALGCKVNRFESEALAQLAQARGHEIVQRGADVCILNSCTVTATSDHKNIRAIHRLRRDNPDAVLAVSGCMAQMEPDKLRATGQVDLICGTSDRAAVLDLCERFVRDRQAEDTARFRAPARIFEPLPPGVPRGRTRALLKVQDGCDNYCTYCIIPYARGHIRSLPLADAVEQAKQLAADGVHEIVLTGIEISSYGRDLEGGVDLVTLIAAIGRAVPAVRVRLSSLEPRSADARFCTELAGLPGLMPHFHLSLQSGCDSVLKRMKRRYTTEEFLRNVNGLRAAFPDCSITTDLITGFPGESEVEFQQTLDFIRACRFADMHVFPYSPRPGTVAADMPGQIPDAVRQARAELVKQAAADMRQAYLQSFVGRRLMVLWEHVDKEGLWCGHAPYHFIVKTADTGCAKNVYHDAEIVGVQGEALLAHLTE
ncbi:MAG: tRNA (N(6)-L-threonylcarbamoyladenosine(37)-C(2))-methylthiotransferase MtaB [Butyricicoccus sp.]